MKMKSVSRREFLSDAALIAIAACLPGCTKSVTKYRQDGTPYTVKEEDWVGTLAAVFLLILVLGVIAASRQDDKKTSSNYEGDWQDPGEDEGKIQLASVTSKRAWPVGNANQKVSVKDSKGKLLVTADAFERVEHHDLGTTAHLLASAQISNLDQPVAICLKQDKLNSYRIEQIRPLRKPSRDSFKVFNRLIKGKLYEIKVHTNIDGSVEVEIASKALSGLYVA